MLFVNYNGATLPLFLLGPNWASEIKVEISLPGVVKPAISRLEWRRNFGLSNRYALEYVVDTADARESTDLHLWLLRLKNETVAVPMWTDAVALSNSINAGATSLPKTSANPVQFGAEWIILSDDGSVFEIVVVAGVTADTVTLTTGCLLNWPAGTRMFPLLFARLTERPKFTAETDTLLNGTIKFTENSPYARRLNPYAGPIPVVGANVPEFSATPLWDIQPNHSKAIDHTEVDILSKMIGFGREQSDFAYAHAVARGQEFEFFQTSRDEIARVLRFFTDRRGSARLFMLPTFRSDMQLAGDLPVAGNGTRIVIQQPNRYSDADYATHPGAPYIALVDPFGVDAQRVNGVAGGNLTTSQPVLLSHSAADTKVSHLLLVHFAESKLSWTYHTDGQATARIKFIEVPNEYAAGTPANPPERAKLYKFTEFVDLPVVRGYYTSYEQSLTWDGSLWQPAPYQHKGLKSDIKLSDKIDLETWDFSLIAGVIAANPVRRIVDGTLEGILWCDVVEVNALAPDDGSAFIEIAGEVVGLDASGKEWKFSLDPFGSFLDRNLPGFYRQKVCNVPLFSPKCAFGRPTMREDFKSLGTIVAKTVTTVDLAPVSGQPDPTAKATDYFAGGGWLESGTGLTFERRTITHSEVIAGNLRLTFARALLWPAIGDQLRFWPGCNGSVDTCRNVFNNLANGRMHPYIPNKNPSVNIGEVQQSEGGKKG